MELALVPVSAHGNFYEGDCYVILSTRRVASLLSQDIHFWIGKDSSQDEQSCAAIYTTQLDDYLGGSPVQHREVQYHESDTFRGYFKQGIIYKQGGVASGMKHVETNTYDVKRLLHVKGKRNIRATEVEMSWDSFNRGDVFLLDLGKVIIQWNGPESNSGERLKGFIKMKSYPSSTNVETVNDGAESAMFKQLFQKWSVKDQTMGLGKTFSIGKIAKVFQDKFDVTLLHTKPEVAAQERMVDDGNGKVEVWRIENLELVPVEYQWYGFFYGGDCYLVLYTYEVNGKPHHILYIWQGRHASQDELAASAYQAVEVDRQFDGAAVQVRVRMGMEPRHFMAIFKGKLVIFEGGTSRKGNAEPDPPVRLFQIHGNDKSNTKAVEVPAFASSLNSSDVFLLRTQAEHYLWYGKGSSGDERAMAKELASLLCDGSENTVAEGQEPAEFWDLLGGKTPYANDKRLQQEILDVQSRLFECSNKTGQFIVTEITDFTQDDLNPSDVMLLDTWDQAGKTYEQLKEELGDAAAIMRITADMKNATLSLNSNDSEPKYYPIAVLLKNQNQELPEDVNPAKKEVSG
ncbi:AVIL isoform 5 [Pan troglodytes]|uniref:AVIL isoform 5 n=1 Tax=Pan troglodytes TaxID=9598 RepID=A0A2J8KVU5_PANTR|nr:AVIL isoform 5 [Pan troglodytes]